MAMQGTSTHDQDELEEVFSSHQESEAMVVKGLLDSEGIDAIMISREAPQDVLPGVGPIAVLVNPGQAEHARQIIAEQISPGDGPEEEFSEEES